MKITYRVALAVFFAIGSAGLVGCGTEGAGPQSEAEVQSEDAANEAGYEDAAAAGDMEVEAPE